MTFTHEITDKAAAQAGTYLLGGELEINRFGYGAMRLTGQGIWGPPEDRAAARAVLRAAVDVGINFIDTADSYGPDENEALIAEALKPYKDDLVIATKAGLLRTGPSEWHPCGKPAYLRQQAEMSLRRLGVEQIDLWQLHRIDPDVDVDDQFAVMKDLQDEGKVRFLGLSEVDVDTLDQAVAGGLNIASVQNRYNLVVRDSDPVLEKAEELGIAFIPWFPIAQGLLADTDGEIARIAAEHDATTAQLCLAWLLLTSPATLPIPGTSAIAHLHENVAAAQLDLDDDEVEKLSTLGKEVADRYDVPEGA
jgi:pyridoxine 4-dehydrogenase